VQILFERVGNFQFFHENQQQIGGWQSGVVVPFGNNYEFQFRQQAFGHFEVLTSPSMCAEKQPVRAEFGLYLAVVVTLQQ